MTDASPSLNILAQYIKDLSFENPGAPRSLQSRDQAPAININVNVNANPLSDTDFDVVLTLNTEARDGDKVVFNCELVYGGVFRISGFPQEHMLPLLFIECPRLLFPFARQIIAEAVQNGGFPAFYVPPIDFAALYQQRMEEMGQGGAAKTFGIIGIVLRIRTVSGLDLRIAVHQPVVPAVVGFGPGCKLLFLFLFFFDYMQAL